MRHRATGLHGRDGEVGNLIDLLADARSGRGRAVFITGENGVGTSRLAAEATELAHQAGMSLMRGRSSSLGLTAPFRPLIEAIMSVQRTHPVKQTDLGPYAPILGRLIPEWSSTAPDHHHGSLAVLGEAVLRLVGLVGDTRGCVICLDDLHDADPETLAVVEYLVDNIDQQPLLLIGSVRDEDCPAMTLARAAARRGRCELVSLGRLSRAELGRVVVDCLDADRDAVADTVIDMVWTGSFGNPSLAEELVAVLVADGALVSDDEGWRVAELPRAQLSTNLARLVARQVSQLGSRTRDLLSVAAVFGVRFPLVVVQRVAKLSDRDLLSLLHNETARQLVAPDEQTRDWYAFHNDHTHDTVLAAVERDDRRRLAGELADAVENAYSGLPGEWCEMVAHLRLSADDHTAAGERLTEVGQRALGLGAAVSAVAFLDRALDLLPHDHPGRAAALDLLLHALAEAGMVERALASSSQLELATGLTPYRRATLHTRLAWAAAVAGQTRAGLAQVETARALLAPDSPPEFLAPIEVVAAHLALDGTDADQRATAERLARRAVALAEAVPLHVVACQAWQLLGGLVRHRDPEEATACLERARAIAVQHELPIWEIHALIRLGNDDALRNGDLSRLVDAREKANRMGAVTAGYQADASLALHTALFGDHRGARSLVDDVLASTARLNLMETVHYALLTRAVIAGHRGDRLGLRAAIVEFECRGGNLTLHAPRVHGLASAFCALLEEDQHRAVTDLAVATESEQSGSSVYFLSGRYGLHLLLRALAGHADRAEVTTGAANPAGSLRWDRQFSSLALAVLHGRAGDPASAMTAVTEALAHAEPYAMSRHLCMRLVGEAALDDGWADPVPWLRSAEDYFHRNDVPLVAGACRALLRRAGARVPQRRDGSDKIPTQLRATGVTVREFEVLDMLRNRSGNREIAARLHLSPRTVERHIRSLLGKTGLTNRVELARLLNDITAGPSPDVRSLT